VDSPTRTIVRTITDKTSSVVWKCGYDIHADYNAAKNIGLKYLRDQQSLDVEAHL